MWEQCNHQPEAEYICSTEDVECVCTGTVHYGRQYNDMGGLITTLEAMQNFSTTSLVTAGTVACSNAQLGDPAPSLAKQCICVSTLVLPEHHVAAAGGNVNDYSCDPLATQHAVRCCADERRRHNRQRLRELVVARPHRVAFRMSRSHPAARHDAHRNRLDGRLHTLA